MEFNGYKSVLATNSCSIVQSIFGFNDLNHVQEYLYRTWALPEKNMVLLQWLGSALSPLIPIQINVITWRWICLLNKSRLSLKNDHASIYLYILGLISSQKPKTPFFFECARAGTNPSFKGPKTQNIGYNEGHVSQTVYHIKDSITRW